MAGIGFELKKIFKEESIVKIAGGVTYGALVTVGPTIIVIVSIIILYFVLGLMYVPYTERELLSSTILYVFIFSLLTTSSFNGVMSRYIADKIYEEKYDDILPSFYTGKNVLNTLLGAIVGVPFIFRIIFIGGVDIVFSFVTYCFFIIMIITFYSMIYLSATKDYKIIAKYYVCGMVITFISSNVFHRFGIATINSILYGITLGFLIIAFLEFAYMRKYFSSNSRNYKDCLHYFKDYKNILLCNFFYILGLYIHNFVFRTHPSHIVIAKSYVSMQSYDMASCLAMFTNISTIVIFTIMVETKFHDKYQMYNEAVIGKTLRDIDRTKKSMFRLLIQQVSYLVGIQAIITTIIFLIGIIVLPIVGFSGSVINIYPSLVITYFVIFVMYCNIIFIFYFNDTKGAMATSIIFCISVLIGSIISINLPEALYGAGSFVGGFIGWSFSYFRIQYIEKHFDELIFCRTNMLKVKVGEMPSSKVYANNVNINHNEEMDKFDYVIDNHIKEVAITSIKYDNDIEYMVGDRIELYVEASGGKELMYSFILYDDKKHETGYVDYYKLNNVNFTPEYEGIYEIEIRVKDKSSSNEYDCREVLYFNIKEKFKGVV